MDTNRRHNDRISAKIRAQIVGRQTVETSTVNVSRNGVFLKDTAQRPVNGVVRIRLYLPPEQAVVNILGRVAWSGKKSGFDGVGVQFLNLDTDARKKWIEFVAHVENLDASNHSIRTDEPSREPSPPVEAERRATPRTLASFMVRFSSKNRLEHFMTNNLSQGGMFLRTPVLRQVGERVQVVIIHPDTEEDFEIDAEVAHVNEQTTEQAPKGMGLKFISLTPEVEKALNEFIAGKKP
ncbi:MAG: PilZ domain-containing protein [Pseudomonadota bacterium]